MLSDVPNFAFAFGYTHLSWTLKVDLVCQHLCRLLAHMDAHGHNTCRAVADPGMETRPFIEFSSGYVQRAMAQWPRQGTDGAWRVPMNYEQDTQELSPRAGHPPGAALLHQSPAGPGTCLRRTH